MIGLYHQGRQAGGQAIGFMLKHGELGQLRPQGAKRQAIKKTSKRRTLKKHFL
jgi:hypothetical protein